MSESRIAIRQEDFYCEAKDLNITSRNTYMEKQVFRKPSTWIPKEKLCFELECELYGDTEKCPLLRA